METEFRAWAEESRPRLRMTAFMLTSDWYLSDDLVQETLMRLFVVWPRVVKTGTPDAYARRVLINKFLDSRRRSWRGEVPQESLPDLPAVDPYIDPRREEVVAALRNVPDGQRAVLVLRFWDDLSVEQTAQVLGCSTGNVKSQTSRGLDALRRALAHRGIDQTFRQEVAEP